MIEYILNPQSVEALGWTLLHSLWQGAAFALLLVLILIALRSYSAKSRYVVSVGLLCAFFLTLTGTFYLQWQDANSQHLLAAQELDNQMTGDVFAFDDSLAGPITSADDANNTLPIDGQVLATNQTNWLTQFSDYYNQHLPLLVTIWFLGILFLQLRLLGQLAYVQRLKHYGAQLFPATWNDRIQELEDKLRIQKKVGYLTSIRIESPMVIGWLKPVVLMPQALFNSLSDTEIYAVLAHEIAHIRREDFIVNLLQTFLCNVFFFHPGVWWMSNRIDDEREHCCDDLAVAATGPATNYAKTLINVSEFQLRMQGHTPLAMALAGKSKRRERGGFSGRIQRLFKTNDGAGSFREGFATALILTSALFLGVAATGSTGQNQEETIPSDTSKTEVLSESEDSANIGIVNQTTSLSSATDTDNPFIIVSQEDQAKLSLEGPEPPVPPVGPPAPASPAGPAPISITQSAAVSVADDTRIDALVMACRVGDFDFVKSLVDLGVDVEGIGSDGVTPLMMATSNQEDEIVEYLLKQGADVNQHYNNWTALIEAADEGSLSSMKYLLDAGANVNFYESSGSPTAITMAASEGHLDCLELLIERGADINGIGKSVPPLHLAAGEGKGSIVNYLISQEVNVNKRDASGRTALMHATAEGKKSIVKKLVTAGADISIRDNHGATARNYAIEENEHGIRNYLEDISDNNSYKGNDSEDIGDNYSDTGDDSEDIGDNYSDTGDDSEDIGDNYSDVRDNRRSKRMPKMHQATFNGHIEIVERMVRRGADVNTRDNYGQTPLHIASAQGYDIDMRVLINLGADLNAQDNQGRTPLMHAAADGLGDAVALLVSMQADVNIKDVDGMRAFEWAQSGGNRDLANFLGLITEKKKQEEQDDSQSKMRGNGNRNHNNRKNKRAIKDAQKVIETEQKEQKVIEEKIENKQKEQILKQIEIREEFHVADDGTHLRQYNLKKKTPALFQIIHNGDIKECILLLEDGMSANAADGTGQTALMVAASTNNYDIAKLLIQQGADVNKSSASGVTALHYAALENNDQIARLLLKNNAKLEATMRYSSTDGNYSKEPLVWEYIGATPLLIATESGNAEVLSVLINAGANANLQLIRNEYRLNDNREAYLDGGEVMGLDGAFLDDVKVRSSDNEWTPYKQALLLDNPEILTFFKK